MTDACVLDTSAVIAYLRDEPGAERVRSRLRFGYRIMHAVNVAELCFTAPKRMPERFSPESTMVWFNAMDIAVSGVYDSDFLQLSAEIRLKERSLSVGDGMTVALASMLNLPVMTTERNFRKVHEYATIEVIR